MDASIRKLGHRLVETSVVYSRRGVHFHNHDVKDASRNISPIAIWLGGEELHNNHHTDPHSAKFAHRWFEFDIGWLYITLLSYVGLAKVKYARVGAHVRVAE